MRRYLLASCTLFLFGAVARAQPGDDCTNAAVPMVTLTAGVAQLYPAIAGVPDSQDFNIVENTNGCGASVIGFDSAICFTPDTATLFSISCTTTAASGNMTLHRLSAPAPGASACPVAPLAATCESNVSATAAPTISDLASFSNTGENYCYVCRAEQPGDHSWSVTAFGAVTIPVELQSFSIE
jgi:hypothetical protein